MVKCLDGNKVRNYQQSEEIVKAEYVYGD